MSPSVEKPVAAAFILLGVSLFGWLLYDATAVMSTLGLAGLMSEAGVVISGLAVALASVGFGVARYRRARRRAPAAA